jgi:hypothetical protein
MFEDMEEELEWFDEPPSFSDLCVRLKGKFGDDFILKGRFDSGKTKAHYVLMPLHDHAHWSCYNRVIQGCNVVMAEVVVENGYRMCGLQDEPSFDGVGDTQQECGVHVEPATGTMDLNSQLT